MNEEEAREIIDNMSEQELNNFIFFALKEVEKENQKLKTEIENKDKEILKLKNNNKDLLRKLRNRVKEVKKLTKYSSYKKEFSTLNKQLQRKDKIIDLMAKCIDTELSSSRLGIKLNKNVKPLESYKKDIKQYFERKVENEN